MLAKTRKPNGNSEKPAFEVVNVKAIAPHSITVTIQGISPLLCDRMHGEWLIKDGGRVTPELTPEEKFHASYYPMKPFKNGRPHYGFPAQAIKSACVSAGRVTKYKMTELRALFFVLPEENGLVTIWSDKDPVLDTQVVHKPNGAVLSHRARFDDWKITFEVVYNPEVMAPESILNTIEAAGFHIGIGARRPEKNGDYGRFTVVPG